MIVRKGKPTQEKIVKEMAQAVVIPNVDTHRELVKDGQGMTALISVIERAASNPEIDVEKMERLLVMQERIFARQAEIAFNDAMNRAQSAMRPVGVDSKNSQTHSEYASYTALDKVLRPIYTQEGFSLSFDTGESPEGSVLVLCHVSHNSGHSRQYRAMMPADGKGAKGGDVMTRTHAVGSGMTYGMRYLLKLIFNVAIGEDDDDGNGGVEPERITEQQSADILALIEEVKADTHKFLRFLSSAGRINISKVSDIPANMLKEAVAALEAKRKENTKEKK